MAFETEAQTLWAPGSGLLRATAFKPCPWALRDGDQKAKKTGHKHKGDLEKHLTSSWSPAGSHHEPVCCLPAAPGRGSGTPQREGRLQSPRRGPVRGGTFSDGARRRASCWPRGAGKPCRTPGLSWPGSRCWSRAWVVGNGETRALAGRGLDRRTLGAGCELGLRSGRRERASQRGLLRGISKPGSLR